MENGIQNDGMKAPACSEAETGDGAVAEGISFVWSAIGATVQGASHKKNGKPNQDAMGWLPETGISGNLILAVSDGHGSEKSFRSQHGSQEAVRIALKVLHEAISCSAVNTTLSMIKEQFEARLTTQLVQEWVTCIEAHHSENPFTDTELAALRNKGGDHACLTVSRHPLLAYGATILAVIINERYCCCLQLGDGDIVFISSSGEASRPLPKDDRLIANETTSLCLEHAWRDFRVNFQPLTEKPPALIMLSTDGYLNSFEYEEGFLKAGGDYLALLTEHGPDVIREQLPDWLDETSRFGSGDDVTVLLASRQKG